MRLALDTNRYGDVFSGEPETLQLLEEAELVVVPFVVVGELREDFRLSAAARARLIPTHR